MGFISIAWAGERHDN